MDRRSFIGAGCACGALFAAGLTEIGDQAIAAETPSKDDLTYKINPAQMMAVLTDIDRTKDKTLIDAVFNRLGYQCFHARDYLVEFAKKQQANFQAYVDYVNSDKMKYWERLDYDKQAGVLKVTSRKFGKCVCAFAQCEKPAKALCTNCCKTFQEELFKGLTGRKAEVEITESILLGGERCRTTVRLSEKA